MSQLKIVVVLLVTILLQLSLLEVWHPLSYIDIPLVVVVYIALQRDAWKALLVGTLAGLIIDAGSGGLIGAGGFSDIACVERARLAGLCGGDVVCGASDAGGDGGLDFGGEGFVVCDVFGVRDPSVCDVCADQGGTGAGAR